MAKKKLSREEKNIIKEEKKFSKLEQIRNKTILNLHSISEEKEPLLLNAPLEDKIPAILTTINLNNVPRAILNPNEYKSMNIVLHLENKDVIDSWSWGLKRNTLDTDYKTQIEPYLEHLKTTKWGTLESEMYTNGKGISKTKHHHIPLSGLKEEIQNRWKEIDLEHSEAFTFRISGKKRIWGFRRVNNYFIIWWDPKHELIPM